MKKFFLLTLMVTVMAVTIMPSNANAMKLLLNYQGQLSDASGTPVADGNYNIIYSLWDDSTMGTELWAESLTVAVSGGIFSSVLGNFFPPDPIIFDNQLYIQIQVGTDAPMMPRSVMTSSPYAAMALSVPGFTSGPDNVVTGSYAFVAGNNNTVIGDYGSITGGQMNIVENLNYATSDFDTTGLFDGVSPVSDFNGFNSFDKSLSCPSGLGWVGSGFSNVATGSYAVVAGGSDNQSTGAFSSILGGCQNRARDRFDVVTGGFNNQTALNGGFRVIAGGYSNMINSSWISTIGGGYNNIIDAPTTGGTIAGGYFNRMQGHVGSIGGGYFNSVLNFGGTVAGGRDNTAISTYTTVSGGRENSANQDYATVGGGYGNNAIASMSTIGGGGRADLVDPTSNNEVYDNYGTIGGGGSNKAGSNDGIEINDQYPTIGGGYFNQTLSGYSTVGGGYINAASGVNATIGGGRDNFTSNWAATISGGQSNEALGYVSTVGGGLLNLLIADSAVIGGGTQNQNSGVSSVIAGGFKHTITVAGTNSVVGGGAENLVQASGATIAGGSRNTISTIGGGGTIGGGSGNIAGNLATVPGGVNNEATGDNSFAAGSNAKATHSCSFVWADCCNDAAGIVLPLYSNAANTYSARATGGFYFFTACDTLWDTTAPPSGAFLPTGGSMWVNGSDKNLKRNIREVNSSDLLDKVSSLPIYQWSYKTQDASIEHIGPMAQDFYKTFQIGDNNTSIGALDPAGISLAAIKELHNENNKLQTEIAKLKKQVDANKDLAKKVSELSDLVQILIATNNKNITKGLAVTK